jgi:2-haloacid dehalogenase
MSGALITRSGNALLPVPGLRRPNAVGSDLPALAREMVRMWRT